jgi:hypothetical protein
MTFKRTTYFALAALLAITLAGFTASAQRAHSTSVVSGQELNLSNAQVLQLQGMVQGQTTDMRVLSRDVQARQEMLKAAIADNDSVRMGMAFLALDASEKALKNTQQADQRNLLSLLNDSQKQIFKDYLTKSASASE